jgi:hypothetical protein
MFLSDVIRDARHDTVLNFLNGERSLYSRDRGQVPWGTATVLAWLMHFFQKLDGKQDSR